MHFERSKVFIKSDIHSKAEVVEFLGQQLVQAGAVQPDYIKAMHKREQDVGTYITEGVAIPHGTEESRSLVKKSAIVVLKLPEGIDWIAGQKVYLTFGIAGNNEDHVALLGELATILLDSAAKDQLMAADTVEALFNYLEKNTSN